MKKAWYVQEKTMLLISILLLLLDQLIKALFYTKKPYVDLHLLKLQFVHNTGASFGILQGQNTLLIWVSLIVLGLFMIYYPKLEQHYKTLGFIVLAGVFSNTIDRIFRNGVVDYINFGWFPVFNIADMLIVLGIGTIIFIMWKEDTKK